MRGRAGGSGAAEPASNGGGGRGAGGGGARVLRALARMRGAGPRGAPGQAGPGPVSAEGPVPMFAPSAALGIPGGARLPPRPRWERRREWGEGARPELPPPLRFH